MKFYRALIRIASITDKCIRIKIPGWNPRVTIKLNREDIPYLIAQAMKPGFRCHAYINKGAEETKDLVITQWEWNLFHC